MKKLLVTVTAALVCVGAFAQGKVAFQNDSLRLVYFDPNAANLRSGDAALAGQPTPLPTSTLPSGVTLVADLYMGTDSSSLSLYSSTTFDATAPGPGKWQNVNVQAISPLILGGTRVNVEVQVRETTQAAPGIFAGRPAGYSGYYGQSALFQYTLGSGSTYPVLWNQTVGNWPAGTFNLDNSAAGTGSRGAIQLSAVIPEPGTFALCGLGAAALVIFRRRK